MRIAMIGQKGVPATFGGIEHHVEELGARLAARGHDVTVFCRRNYSPSSMQDYRGMHLHHARTVDAKHFDAISHSARATAVAIRKRFDVIHYHALGPGLLLPMARAFTSAGTVLTVHGWDDERAKWSPRAKAVLRMAGWVGGHAAHEVIAVSAQIQHDVEARYSRPARHVPNGVRPPHPRPPGPELERLGLRPGGYLLYVGRLVPEKAADLLVRAFGDVSTDARLVLVGGSSFSDDYVRLVTRLAEADDRVVLADYVYGDALSELYSNAAAFVLPSALEGLPLTLLEAASYGLPLVASAIPPHREVVGDHAAAALFDPGDGRGLTAAIESVLARLTALQPAARSLRADVLKRFSWDAACAATEAVYQAASSRRRSR
jgi:glycosyltransferase involved in cell wall biosynthesis